jgi:NitT/TauT family transport system permease protein
MDRKKGTLYSVIGLSVVCVIWFFAARSINRSLVLPDFIDTMSALITGLTDRKVMSSLFLTLERVFIGFGYAVALGLPFGLLMGYSLTVRDSLAPLINSVRQVPIMAWVPLSIIWFGLGDGPAVFLITMSAVFPLLINTMSGVMTIDNNYKFAAESLGAKTFRIFVDVIIPGAMPHFLTGCRLALGYAWMSVICAEFIASSSGFGVIMVEAQARMQTPKLYALMIMSAIVGYLIDRVLLLAETKLTAWRFKDAVVDD